MGRIWVLDTETKGTGAEMVPLDQVQRRPARKPEALFVPPKPKPREPEPPAARSPRAFKVVDVMTQAVLANRASARETLRVLSELRSVVDVNVSVWEPSTERWRLLTLGEQRMLWENRASADS